MQTIINPEGIEQGAINNALIYGKGAHSTDLQEKGLLPEGTEKNTAHHVILPITIIERAVLELLNQGISQQDIISYAGVMAKAPNGIPAVHALWGPAAKTKLKIAVAMETFGKGNTLMNALLEKMAANDITIIETNKPEHDSKMAIIQGLINLWLVMVGELDDPDIQGQLIQPWKTPIGTIVDMIHANPVAEMVIKGFFESLDHHGHNASAALESTIREYLTSSDLEKFGTPNSSRVIDFISQRGGNIFLREKEVQKMREELNTNGHRSLTQRMKKIRGQE